MLEPVVVYVFVSRNHVSKGAWEPVKWSNLKTLLELK